MNKIYMPQPIIPGNKASNSSNISQQNQLKPGQPTFAHVLHQQLEQTNKLKFSSHAQKRLAERNISVDASEMAKLESALDKAREKGAKESLVLIDNRAYVISVPNKVVITAVDGNSLKENVFTNIDSAIIM